MGDGYVMGEVGRSKTSCRCAGRVGLLIGQRSPQDLAGHGAAPVVEQVAALLNPQNKNVLPDQVEICAGLLQVPGCTRS